MGWVSTRGRETVSSEDEAMAEEVRPTSAITNLQDNNNLSEEEEELLSVASHSSEEELETINSAMAEEDPRAGRKRTRPGSSFSSDDDDEVSDILSSSDGEEVIAGDPVEFSATPPVDLPLPRPGRVPGTGTAVPVEVAVPRSASRPPPPKTLHFNDNKDLPSIWTKEAAKFSALLSSLDGPTPHRGFHRPNMASALPLLLPRPASTSPMAPTAIPEGSLFGGGGVGGPLGHQMGQQMGHIGATGGLPTRRHHHSAHQVRMPPRQPRPFLDFEKMRQKAAHALTTWKHGSELTLACR